jgi:hypothetical protein
MKKSLVFLFGLALIGAGCSASPTGEMNRRTAWNGVQGIDLLLKAEAQNGSPVVAYYPSIGRRFRSKLAPTFTDYNGSYRMADGASIEIQMGVKGTPDNDEELFRGLPGLSSFAEGDVSAWHAIAAYDNERGRWVLRATQKDLGFGEDGYHVIECLSDPKSDFVFWDGCRTLIENAQVVADAQ